MARRSRSLVTAGLLGLLLVAPALAGLAPPPDDTTTTTTLATTTLTETTTSTTETSTTSTEVSTTSTSTTLVTTTVPTIPDTSTSTTSTVLVTTSSSTTTVSTRTTRTVRDSTSTTTTPVPTTTTTSLGPPPPCPGITTLQRARIVTTSRGSTVTVRAQLFGLPLGPFDYDPSRDGIAIYFGDQSGDAVAIPPGRRGSGCKRTDGWQSHAGRTVASYLYRNTSGAVPAECDGESAAGVRLVRVQDALVRDGTIHVRVRRVVVGADPHDDAVEVTIVLGGASAQDMCVRLTLACAGTGPTRTCR